MALVLEKRRSEVEQQILLLKNVHEVEKQLQRDVTELRRYISNLETLSLTPDHNQIILHCPLLSTNSQSTQSTHSQSRIPIRPRRYFEDVRNTLSEFSYKVWQTDRF